jgi:Leucine-rich repeat (LRR) protein
MSQPADKLTGKAFLNSVMDSMDSNESNPDDTFESPRPNCESSIKFAPPLEPGDLGRLGKYRIVQQLGRGGMGVVYLAFDTLLNRNVALKIMHPQFAAERSAKERFLREARATAQITHDNVVTIYEADEREGVSFIAMQFLEGCSLNGYLHKNGTPTIQQTLRLAREAASGLAAAHKIGLVHRDIKPANLWMEAPNGRVKVLDFGLAKPMDAEKEVTKSGEVVGTPAYMSLEQGRGQKVDHRTDLFSLGAVMYRLCTGKLPFDGPTTMAVLIALGNDEPTPVRELNPRVPEPLAGLIHQLLSKKPEERPATADEVVKRIRAISEQLSPGGGDVGDMSEAESVVVEATEVMGRGQRKPRGRGKWIAAGFAAFLALVIAGVVIIVIKNKDGTETKIEVPDDATVTVTKDGKEVARLNPGNTKPFASTEPKSSEVADPDRRAAAYVLSVGGNVKVNGLDNTIGAVANLPKDRFAITYVNLGRNQLVTDKGLENLKDCDKLLELHLDHTKTTDKGIAAFKGNTELKTLDLAESQVTDAGLESFKDCKKLTYLNLTFLNVTDTGLGYFKDCKNLNFLSLARAPITDAGLANFKDSKGLTYLDLTDTPITNAGLAHFKDCKELRFLHLPGTLFTDSGLAYFKDCKNLLRATLRYTKLTDEGLAYLKDCKNLEGLWVEGTQVTDAGLAYFKDCKSLKTINVSNTKVTVKFLAEFRQALPQCKIEGSGGPIAPKVAINPDRKAAEYVFQMGGTIKVNQDTKFIRNKEELPNGQFKLSGINLFNIKTITDANLAIFKDCKNLTYIHLSETGLTDAGLEYFRGLPDLKFLELGGTRVSDKGLAIFRDCQNITQLYLQSTQVTDEGLLNFKNCKNLTSLFLQRTRITDAGLALFSDCKKLKEIQLDSTKVTDVGLATFKGCTNLVKLILSGLPVGDDGLGNFAGNDDLGILYLENTKLGNAGLANFKGCKKLWILRLHNTKLTDEGLAYLAEMKNLREVYLDSTGVTDAGMRQLKDVKNLNVLSLANTEVTDKCLDFLKDCTTVNRLYLKKTKVSEKGLQELHKALPKCMIEYDGGTIEPEGK